MATNDVYQLILDTSYKFTNYGQNAFYYQSTSTATTQAQKLLDAFLASVVPSIRAIQTNDISYNSIAVINLFDRAEIANYAFPSGTLGTRAGTSEPPFVSVAYKFARTRADMRNGSKRFWGIPESDVEDGIITDATIAPYNTLLDKLNDTISIIGIPTATFDPVVVKRVKGDDTLKTTYRLPRTQAELVFYRIQNNAELVRQVTSQVSRKFAR